MPKNVCAHLSLTIWFHAVKVDKQTYDLNCTRKEFLDSINAADPRSDDDEGDGDGDGEGDVNAAVDHEVEDVD